MINFFNSSAEKQVPVCTFDYLKLWFTVFKNKPEKKNLKRHMAFVEFSCSRNADNLFYCRWFLCLYASSEIWSWPVILLNMMFLVSVIRFCRYRLCSSSLHEWSPLLLSGGSQSGPSSQELDNGWVFPRTRCVGG